MLHLSLSRSSLKLSEQATKFHAKNSSELKICHCVVPVDVSILPSPLSWTNRDVDSMQIARMRLREGSIGHSASP